MSPSTGAGLGDSHLSSIRRPADVDIKSTAPLVEVLCNTSLGMDNNHLLSLANTYTIITGVSKLLVNNIWVVDSDARVELFRYRIKMDENNNKAYFSEVQYRFSRGHNAAKTATFPANRDRDNNSCKMGK